MTSSSQVRLSVILLVVAFGLTATVDAFAKYLSPSLHSVQITWGFFVMTFLAIFVFALARGRNVPSLLRTPNWRLQLARSGSVILSITLLFVGIAYIPFADAIAISFMAPLFVTILAVPILKEPFRWQWLRCWWGLAGW